MTGPTPTHSDQNPVSGMAMTPSASGGRTEALSLCQCWVQSPLTGHSGGEL